VSEWMKLEFEPSNLYESKSKSLCLSNCSLSIKVVVGLVGVRGIKLKG
jgi:hypothetical protein